jgi:serine/threonine-protein kinase
MEALVSGMLLDRRYRILYNLATGGFGRTYVAADTRRPGNPRCVVKHLQPLSPKPKLLENARRLFQAEAETLEQLGNHDQIPQLLAYFEQDREFYLVQELVEGRTLTHELQPGAVWTEAHVCQMLQDVLSVLAFVHAQGVIHRDIKPDNLIRRLHDRKLVLVDFGTVKQIQTLVDANQSASTIMVGTPGYMPTEQGHGSPRPNSDIYALGIIGIQAITGLKPNQFQEDLETGELLWQPWAHCSPDLIAILTQMTRYYFKERYKSATDVLQALNPLLRSERSIAPTMQPALTLEPPTAEQLAQMYAEAPPTVAFTSSEPDSSDSRSATLSSPNAITAALLRDLLDADDARLRARAAIALGHIGNAAAIPALKHVLSTDPSSEVRRSAAKALEGLDGKE